ncbi:MAG: hypothetical protein Q9174_003322 [Haloplaca sp. 1 TL-2023]
MSIFISFGGSGSPFYRSLKAHELTCDLQPSPDPATVTSPSIVETKFACLPSNAESTTPTSSVTLPAFSPSAAPEPPQSEGQTLIDQIQTMILYASLIGNDGNLPKLCSVINPAALDNETGINGTAVQQEVCAGASISLALGQTFTDFLVQENQVGVSFLYLALFAVQATLPSLGVIPANQTALCNVVEEDLLNRLSIGYIEGRGTAIKQFVCEA